jgi:hypothetical protein
MPSTEMETVVRFTDTQATVRFPNGVVMTVTDNGEVSIKSGTDTFAYSPSRLRKNTTTLYQTGETTEGSQKFAVDEKTILHIKTERSERLNVEVFFHEATEEGTEIGGCFITKYSDWGINFVNSDRFLVNLNKLFAIQAV